MYRRVTLRLCLGALLALASLAAMPQPAAAQVSPTGFIVTHTVNISAPPERVYDTLTRQISAWWNPEHTYSGEAKNLSLDLKPGGCFCETLPNGGGVEHARVLYLAPGATLRLSGALGPLQNSGVTGSLTWTLTRTVSGTTVLMNYSVGGFIGGPFDALAPVVRSVLADQLERMKRLIETGKPAA